MLLAAKIGAGGLGFLVVLLLIVAAVVIFIAMSGSLKRLRRSVDAGTFEQHANARPDASATGENEVGDADPPAINRDRSGSGGAAS